MGWCHWALARGRAYRFILTANGRERLTLPYTQGQENIQPLETLPCRINDETRKIAVRRGVWLRKVNVLDDLQMGLCKILTTVGRYAWVRLLLGTTHILDIKSKVAYSAYKPVASLVDTARHVYHISPFSAQRPRFIIGINPKLRQSGHISSIDILLLFA
jgi:hypothetical protein